MRVLFVGGGGYVKCGYNQKCVHTLVGKSEDKELFRASADMWQNSTDQNRKAKVIIQTNMLQDMVQQQAILNSEVHRLIQQTFLTT